MNKYEYVISGNTYPDYAYEFKSDWDEDYQARLVEDAAEDYFDNHDGWKDSWPIQLELYINSHRRSIFTVDYESRPVFSAYENKDN